MQRLETKFGARQLEIVGDMPPSELVEIARGAQADIIRVKNPTESQLELTQQGWFYGPASIRHAKALPLDEQAYRESLSPNSQKNLRSSLNRSHNLGIEVLIEGGQEITENSRFMQWLNIYDSHIENLGQMGRNALRENNKTGFRDFYLGSKSAATSVISREGIYLIQDDKVIAGSINVLFAPDKFFTTGTELDEQAGMVYSVGYLALNTDKKQGMNLTHLLYDAGIKRVLEQLNPEHNNAIEFFGGGMDTNLSPHIGSEVIIGKMRLGLNQYPDIRGGTQLVKILNPEVLLGDIVFFTYEGNQSKINLNYVRNSDSTKTPDLSRYYPKAQIYNVKSGLIQQIR